MEMQLTWLLDEKHEEAGASDLRDAIEAVGDRHLTLSRQEARYGSELTLSLHSVPTLAYGSIEFNKALSKEFYPGRWCDWTALRCERYYANLGAFLFNDDYILLPVGEVRRRQDRLLQEWGGMFLRPSRADKPFSGFVIHGVNADEIERRLASREAHELVVLARAKEIEAEYRTVAVRGRGIVTASQYMQDDHLYLDRKVPAAVEQVATAVVNALGNDFSDPMIVVDIAQSEGQYRLLELNGFSFASFYTCDLEAIVRAAHEEAMREWKEMQG
jgi:hypothetical protein